MIFIQNLQSEAIGSKSEIEKYAFLSHGNVEIETFVTFLVCDYLCCRSRKDYKYEMHAVFFFFFFSFLCQLLLGAKPAFKQKALPQYVMV
jgi:hypothetical protein